MTNQKRESPHPLGELRKAWMRGERTPDLLDFISPEVVADERALADLVALDAGNRWDRELPASLEHYLRLLPAIRDHKEALRQVLMTEVIRRGNEGDAATTDLMGRFPELQKDIEVIQDFAKLVASESSEAIDAMTAATSGDELPCFPGVDVLEEIAPARGGMGRVYRAREHALDRIVAVKVARDHLQTARGRAFFQQEAKAAGQLDHPGIVKIFSYNPDHDPPYYLMQFIEGKPLDEACSGRGPHFIVKALEQAALALAYAHQKGVTHRDIKPGNILCDEAGTAHITDFGLARQYREVLDDSSSSESISGTPAYIAPEVYEDPGTVAPAQDIYALGVTMYRLLTGQLPFQGKNLDQIRHLICESEPALPSAVCPGIAEPLQRICLKAMERNPEARYSSALDLARDLRRFRARQMVQARPSRYRHELLLRIDSHIADLRDWRNQNLITTAVMDGLAQPYRDLGEEDSPWEELHHQSESQGVLLRLGSWLFMAGTLAWPTYYWEDSVPAVRVLVVAVPAILATALGRWFYRNDSRAHGLVFIGLAQILLPLLFLVMLDQFEIVPFRMDQGRELFGAAAAGNEANQNFGPTNIQLMVSSSILLALSAWLLVRLQVNWLKSSVTIAIQAVIISTLLVLGAKQAVHADNVAIVLLFWLMASCACAFVAGALESREKDHRLVSAVFNAFPVAAMFSATMLSWFGASEWLNARNLFDGSCSAWFMINGVTFVWLGIAFSQLTATYVNQWSHVFFWAGSMTLVYSSHLLMGEGPLLASFSGEDLRLGVALTGGVAVCMLMVGMRYAISPMIMLSRLSVIILLSRVTFTCFRNTVAWPLTLALVGGVLITTAVIAFRQQIPQQEK